MAFRVLGLGAVCIWGPRGLGGLTSYRGVVSGQRAGLPALGVASGSCSWVPLWLCSGWPWRNLYAIPELFLPPLLSVLPKRIVEEVPSSNIPTQNELAPGEVTWGTTKSSTTFQSPSSQSPMAENILRGHLVQLLIWGIVVLIAGIATA